VKTVTKCIFFGVSLVLCQGFQTKFLSVFSWHLSFFVWIFIQVKHWVIFKIFPTFFLSVQFLHSSVFWVLQMVFKNSPRKKAGKKITQCLTRENPDEKRHKCQETVFLLSQETKCLNCPVLDTGSKLKRIKCQVFGKNYQVSKQI